MLKMNSVLNTLLRMFFYIVWWSLLQCLHISWKLLHLFSMYVIYVIPSHILYLSFKASCNSYMWINMYIEREIFKCWGATRGAYLDRHYFSYFVPISKVLQSPLIHLLSVRTNYKKPQTSWCFSYKEGMNLIPAFQAPFTYLRLFQWSSSHWPSERCCPEYAEYF